MSNPKIAFIGAGNMASSIISGLLAEGFLATDICACAPRQERLTQLANDLGVTVSTDNLAAAAAAEVVILSVKPQVLKSAAIALQPAVAHRPLIISVAAGITTKSLAQWLGNEQAIVRSMPNTPAQLRQGATGLFANQQVSSAQRATAERILGAVGIVQWLTEEHLLNSVTAVSGSGPAYFFLVMEAMIAAGVELGLTQAAASELTVQTALGAALLAKNSSVDVAELRRQVTSPKGTTEQAIRSFEQDNIREMFQRAMSACSARAEALSEQLGQ